MPVISKTFLQLMGVCPILYTSSAFASPVTNISFTPKPPAVLERRKLKQGIFGIHLGPGWNGIVY